MRLRDLHSLPSNLFVFCSCNSFIFEAISIFSLVAISAFPLSRIEFPLYSLSLSVSLSLSLSQSLSFSLSHSVSLSLILSSRSFCLYCQLFVILNDKLYHFDHFSSSYAHCVLFLHFVIQFSCGVCFFVLFLLVHFI